MRVIGRYMLEFGAVSSLFDLLTFGALVFMFRASPEMFRTSWFVESLLTELAVALVVRTRRPFFQSRPGGLLLVSTLALVPVALAIPYMPFVDTLGFVPLPGMVVAAVVMITVLYVAATEVQKRWFFRHAP
jgi:Mg2+-importing ATPase